jgi:hypothetical protein
VELDPECADVLKHGAIYGLADDSGFVFPAAISAGRGHVGLQEFERVCDNNSIGRLVWKPNVARHAARVLLMGSVQKHRDRFLRWYADIEDLEYERVAAQTKEETSRLEELIRRNGQFSARQAVELHRLHFRLSKLSQSFKVVASLDDTDQTENLAGINIGKGKAPSKILRTSKGDTQPVSNIVERLTACGFKMTWPLLEEESALGLLYYGATASSPLGQYGRATDFIETYSHRVRATRPEDDASRYFTGEILFSAQDTCCPQVKRPPSAVFINAPDIVSENLGVKACGREVWENIGHRISAILAACRQADPGNSETVSRSKFIEIVERLSSRQNESDAQRLLECLFVDESGQVKYEGLESICRPEAYKNAFDVSAAVEMMAEVSDVIIFFLDSNLFRFNDQENKIVQKLQEKFKTKLLIHRTEHFGLKSEVESIFSDVLQNDPLARFPKVSNYSSTLQFLNHAVNEEQIRLLSLIAGLHNDVDNLVKRLGYLYARAQRKNGLEDVAESSIESIVDAHAVAAANTMLVEACRRAKRALGAVRGQPLLEQVRAALKAAQQTAANMLAQSGCAVLNLSERVERWSVLAARRAAVNQAVRRLDLGQWFTQAHVDCWLGAIGLHSESRAVLRSEMMSDVFGLIALDSSRIARLGLPLEDRVKLKRGLAIVRRRFQELRGDVTREGLWRLLVPDTDLGCSPPEPDGLAGPQQSMSGALAGNASSEPDRREPKGSADMGAVDGVWVRLDPARLFDQGPGRRPLAGGWKQGDKVMVDSPGYGRVLTTIPGRSELERAEFMVRVERRSGKLSPEDVGLLYGVVDRAAVEDGAAAEWQSGRRWLEDGVDLVATGDVPPHVVVEMAQHVLLELGSGAVSKRPRPAQGVYGRRWALDAAMSAEAAPESDSDDEKDGSDDTAALSREEAEEGAVAALDRVFDATSGGRITADGGLLQAGVYRNTGLMRLLRRLGVRFVPGRAAVLDERDVLRREFVDGVLRPD